MEQAMTYLQEGRREEAVDLFSSVLRTYPEEAAAYRGRGVAQMQLGHWSSAVSDFTAVKRLAPDDRENRIDLAMSLAKNNQVYPALDEFDTLLIEYPQYVRGHIELGLLHVQLGAIPKGKQQLRQALACQPTRVEREFIEQALKEQNRLDVKRYYRPDFEALHRAQQTEVSSGWIGALQKVVKRFNKRKAR